MNLDIVIVNWQSGNLLENCVSSIRAADNSFVSQIVIVDNASSDDSLQRLKPEGLPIKILRNSVNVGFGRACNIGASVCGAPFILFLNPDCEVRPDSLKVALQFMLDPTNDRVGICGVQLRDQKGVVSRTCAHFPTFSRFAAEIFGLNKIRGLKSLGVHMSSWDHQCTRQVNHVIGAYFLVRRNVFRELDGFDERFFVYLEDLDFSIRASSKGWMSVYLTSTYAYHEGGGTSKKVMARRLFYSTRSRILYSFKHFSPIPAWILLGLTIFIEPIMRIVYAIMRRNTSGIAETLSGYRMLFKDLRTILSRQRLISK